MTGSISSFLHRVKIYAAIFFRIRSRLLTAATSEWKLKVPASFHLRLSFHLSSCDDQNGHFRDQCRDVLHDEQQRDQGSNPKSSALFWRSFWVSNLKTIIFNTRVKPISMKFTFTDKGWETHFLKHVPCSHSFLPLGDEPNYNWLRQVIRSQY